MPRIKALETQSGAMRLLLHLLKGPSYVTLILDETDIPNIQLHRSIDLLERLKLIQKKVDVSAYPKRNIISLTERGTAVAQKVKEIEDLLDEEKKVRQ
ncbi:MAG: winged helix-turn-helix transcriptional regulator [Thermoplasmatales archaeon]